MGNWQAVIDVKEEWKALKNIDELDSNEKTCKEQLKPLIDKLKSNSFYKSDNNKEDYDYIELVDELEESWGFDNFNVTWNQLYNWADYNKVWIKTDF